MFRMRLVSGSYSAGLGLILLSGTSGVLGRTPKPRDTGLGPRPKADEQITPHESMIGADVDAGSIQFWILRLLWISNARNISWSLEGANANLLEGRFHCAHPQAASQALERELASS